MSVSAVIVSYRPGDWLEPCLASVAPQADQVLLVDNGSPGEAAGAIGRRAGVEVLRSERNLGFAPAVNLAAGSASGELMALLNDDAVARPGWLESAAQALSQSGVAAVGPKVVLAQKYVEMVLPDEPWQAPGDHRRLGRQLRSVTVGGEEMLERLEGPGVHRLERAPDGTAWRWTTGPGPWYVPLPEGGEGERLLVNGEEVAPGRAVTLVNSAGAYLDHRGYSGDIGSGAPDEGQFGLAAERFAVSGVAMVVRAEAWAELGPFAAPFFAYYEDIDWCWRARLRGMAVLYDPRATVEHRRSASSGGEHVQSVRVMAERNRTLSLVRNGPRRLVAKALADRMRNGPDGGVRAGIARLLPWAVSERARMGRSWELAPEEVWGRWAGAGMDRADGAGF